MNVTDNASLLANATIASMAEEPVLWPLKLMSIVCTFGLSMLLNALVVCCPAINNSPRVTSLANAFSAGIFIVLSVTHLLGEAIDGIHEGHSAEIAEKYRPALSMACLGYFFMIWLQRCIFKYESGFSVQTQTIETTTTTTTTTTAGVDADDHDCKENQINEKPAVEADIAVIPSVDANTEEVSAKVQKGRPTAEHIPLLVVLAVFYIHSFTEGFVVGLEDTRRGVIIVFLAIFLHQWAEDVTFSLMTGQSQSLKKRWRYGLTIVEASAAPTGIAIGWAVRSAISDLTTSYLTAFSAGTFMMMAMTQTIPTEMKAGQQRWPHGIAMVVGGALIWTVMMLLYDLE